MCVTAQQLSVGTEQLLRDLLESLIEFAPEDFLDRALRSRHTSSRDAAKSPHLIEAHDFNFRAALRELLADQWVFGGGPSVTLDGPREFDEAGDEAFKDEMQASAVGTALVHQRAHRHIPSVIHFAQDILNGHANVAKEQLVEFGFPGHLTQGTNFDAGRFHIHKEDRESFVFSGARVGAHDEFAPIANPAVTGPHFLPVDDVAVAVQTSFHLGIREIGTGGKFGEHVAPDVFSAQTRWDIEFLLVV